MKKRNFITGFSAAFVALITLASCGGIRAKDGVYITVNGKEYYAKDLYNDQKTPAAAEAKFNAVYKVAVRRYFDKDQEGNIYMDEITRNTKLKISGAKEEAKNNASKNKTKYDDEWKKILTSNGVDNESGLYDKFEYDLQKTKFEEKIYDRQFDGKTNGESNYDVLRDGGFLKNNKGEDIVTGGDDKKIPGYLDNKIPYHMKHILVKISGAKENDDTSCEITAAEAKKLCDVIDQLANGTSFETVASSTLNDDETARKNRGSLGIMSRDTEFVNDFKFGTYLFESFFAHLTNGDTLTPQEQSDYAKYGYKDAKSKIFGTDTIAQNYATDVVKLSDPSAITNSTQEEAKLGRIPYEAITDLLRTTSDKCKLYEMDLTQSKTSERFAAISDVKAKYYPRNIIFNKYFNKHNIMVITDSKKPTYESTGDKYSVNESNRYITTSLQKGTEADRYYENNCGSSKPTVVDPDNKAGFKSNTQIKNDNKISDKFLGLTDTSGTGKKEEVLCDENGRVILVFRSGTGGSKSSNDSSSGYQGIHFIVIERSPFVTNEFDTYYDQSGTKQTHTDSTSLKEYYTQYYPGEVDGHHPVYVDGNKEDKKTYVNYVKGEETSKLKDRSSTIKSELKKADSNLNTFVFEYLMKKGEIKFNQSSEEAKDLETTISSWIDNTKRDYTKKTEKKKWDDSWETYFDNLELRNKNRKCETEGVAKGEKIAPEILIPVFAGEKYLSKDATNTYLLKEVFGKEGAYNE